MGIKTTTPITQTQGEGGNTGGEAAVSPSGGGTGEINNDHVKPGENDTGESIVDKGDNGDNGDGSLSEKEQGLEFAKKFEYLTKREKKLREEAEKVKAAGGQVEQLEAEIARYKALEERIQTDPLGVMKEKGWTFKDLTEFVLNDSKETAEKKIERLEKKFEEDLASREQREDEERKRVEEEKAREKEKTYTEQVKQVKESIDNLIEENPDDYELIKTQGANDLVWDVILDVFEQTKKVISIEDAAKRVEDYLFTENEKIFNTKKFQTRFKKVDPITEDEDLKVLEPLREPNHYQQKVLEKKFGRGLTNDMQGEGSGGKQEPQRYLTDEESKRYIAAKLRRKLQNRA